MSSPPERRAAGPSRPTWLAPPAIWLVRRQLGSHRRRAVILILAITAATTAFTVLVGGAHRRQLAIVGHVTPAAPGSYDILVRPAGSRSGAEQAGDDDLVRPNAWQDSYGGITLEQSRQIQALAGVKVAAPIAMVGYLLQTVQVPIPIPTGPTPGLFTADVEHVTDDGLSRIPQPAAAYTYVTTDPLVPATGPGQPTGQLGPTGRTTDVCPDESGRAGPFAPTTRRVVTCWSTRTGPATSWAVGQPTPVLDDSWTFPVLVAAVDPTAEAALDGLDTSVDSGRYLPADGVGAAPDGSIPAILADSLGDDDQDVVTVNQLPSTAAAEVAAGAPAGRIDQLLTQNPGTPLARQTVTATQAYRQLLAQQFTPGMAHTVGTYWTTTSSDYAVTGDGEASVTARPTAPDSTWREPLAATGYAPVPMEASDTAVRDLIPHVAAARVGANSATWPRLDLVGTFDPGSAPASAQAFAAQRLAPADAGSQLGDHALSTNGNLAGYPAGPPSLLIPLSDAAAFTDPSVFSNVNPSAPVSAIRVRVAGVTGTDATSRERIRTVADEISQTTHLDVDVTFGATPTAEKVHIPAGRYGRPALTVTETWYRKSVAVVTVSVLDRKSMTLFILLLLVCSLGVANASAASTRALQAELNQQRRLGLSRGAVLRHLLGEVGLLALIAGLASTALAWPISELTHAGVTAARLAIAAPVALGVGLLSAAVPSWRASAGRPGPFEARPRRWRPHGRGRVRAALVQLLNAPVRSAVGIAAVAVGCAALTLQLALIWVWHGAVVGDRFGVTISLENRGIDAVAITALLAMSAFVLGDVGWLSVSERRAELADLSAQGLRRVQILGLLGREAALLGLAGSVLGGMLGLAAAALLGGTLSGALLAAAAVAILTGTGLASLAGIAAFGAVPRRSF